MPEPFDRPPGYFADFGMQIVDSRLAEVFRHWQSLRDGADVPRADRLDPLDLAAHLRHLFIVRVSPGEGAAHALTYSLIGTALVDALGRDATGRSVSETFPAGHPVTLVYEEIVRRRVPVRTHGRLDWLGREYRGFESLLLPLAGPDGRISKILGAAIYRNRDGSVVGA